MKKSQMIGSEALGNGNDHFGVHEGNTFCSQRGCVPEMKMACEKCWGDAYLRMLVNGKAQAENYRDLLEERKDNPCTPEEQKGQFGAQEENTPQ